jgi:death-on-curing protein
MTQGTSSNIEFLTFEDVCSNHDRGLTEFGQGMPGFLDEHAVRSAAAQPQAGAFGRYFHEFPAGMAAAYLYYLSNQQGFINGNKRTAVTSALTFLARNGYRLNVSRYEVYRFTLDVVAEDAPGDGQSKLASVTKWIKEHLEPME